MKIHPLFEELLYNGVESNAPFSYAAWQAAGKPVVEEVAATTPADEPEPTREKVNFPFRLRDGVINLRGMLDLDAYPELRQIILDSPAKDARIRELEGYNLRLVNEKADERDRANARIKELENQTDRGRVQHEGDMNQNLMLADKLTGSSARVKELGKQLEECGKKLAEAERENSSHRLNRSLHVIAEQTQELHDAKVRNAALEEAAKVVDEIGPDDFVVLEVARGLGHKSPYGGLAARIRGLKK